MSSGTTQRLSGVWGSSATDVFAVGDNGTILHYDGRDWTPMESGSTHQHLGIWGSSGLEVFAVSPYMGSPVLHYDGVGWFPVPTGTEWGYWDIWGSSGSDVFAVGTWGNTLHYDGFTWTPVSTPLGEYLHGIWGSSGVDVFAVGSNGRILYYDGVSWDIMVSGTSASLLDVWGGSSTDVFAVGSNGTILHYDGSNWSPMDSGTGAALYGVWSSLSGEVFAVGEYGTILCYGEDSGGSELEKAGLAPDDPSDAAMVLGLPAGAYTVHVSPEDNSGVGLAEVFDLEPDSSISGTAFLQNISARAYVRTGPDILIAGFVIKGSGTKKIAVRGIGQGLLSHGVATNLDAAIEVYDSERQIIGANDDWQDGDSVPELQDAGLAPLDPSDAALVFDLPAGAYTVHLVPAGAPGIGLAEVFDLEPGAGPTLVYNLSSRAYVQAGDNTLIAGFIIGGTGSKKVALRGIGQGLLSQGVSTDLDASLMVYDSDASILGGNDDWQP
jgi:hypothetical protein